MATTSPAPEVRRARRNAAGAWYLLLGGLAAAGCGPSAGTPVDRLDSTRQKLESIGRAYVWATRSQGRPPASLTELMPFIEKQGKPEDILSSANDGQAFEIVWGVELRQLKTRGSAKPVVAYEKVGKGGKRHVLRGNADVVLLTEGELKASVFPAGYSPS